MIGVWRKLRGRAPAPDLHWVTSDVAIWKVPNPQEWHAVRSAGIDCVLDLRETSGEAALAAAEGIEYRHIAIKEFAAPPSEVLSDAAAWVRERSAAGKRVLVVCREGRGRSAMVCCAALVLGGLPLHSAYQLVSTAQPLTALSDVQAEALEQFSRRLAEDG